MPTFTRPARAEIIEDGGGAIAQAAGAAGVLLTIGAVVTFVLTHLLLLAVASAGLLAGTAAAVCFLRRFIVPRGARRTPAPPPRVLPASVRPAAALPAAQHVHIHLHGLAAQDLAAILGQPIPAPLPLARHQAGRDPASRG